MSATNIALIVIASIIGAITPVVLRSMVPGISRHLFTYSLMSCILAPVSVHLGLYAAAFLWPDLEEISGEDGAIRIVTLSTSAVTVAGLFAGCCIKRKENVMAIRLCPTKAVIEAMEHPAALLRCAQSVDKVGRILFPSLGRAFRLGFAGRAG